MKCSGHNALGGPPVEVEFAETVTAVQEIPAEDAGIWVAPGFIDLQVNGFAGVDYNDPRTSMEEVGRSIQVLFSTGVTRFYPTVITGPPGDMTAALRNLARAREIVDGGEAIDGFHVEGPHIASEDGPRGAHPRQWVRPPDFEEFQRWQEAAGGRLRIVTLAPEWAEAARYIERITAAGVVAAIGHTA